MGKAKIWASAAAIAAVFLFIFGRSKAAAGKKIIGMKTYLPGIPTNVRRFLLMIQKSEGTLQYSDPYKVVVGGGTFNDFSRHPNRLIKLSPTLSSTAAGAYQFLFRTWQGLHLPDFSPANQDKGAIMLIKQAGAYNDIINGNFAEAVYKVRKIWASLPGAGYGQRENKLADLKRFYDSLA